MAKKIIMIMLDHTPSLYSSQNESGKQTILDKF